MGDMNSFIIKKVSLINKKPHITNHRSFLPPSHVDVLEATNHELIPAFTMNVYYEYYTPVAEKML